MHTYNIVSIRFEYSSVKHLCLEINFFFEKRKYKRTERLLIFIVEKWCYDTTARIHIIHTSTYLPFKMYKTFSRFFIFERISPQHEEPVNYSAIVSFEKSVRILILFIGTININYYCYIYIKKSIILLVRPPRIKNFKFYKLTKSIFLGFYV